MSFSFVKRTGGSFRRETVLRATSPNKDGGFDFDQIVYISHADLDHEEAAKRYETLKGSMSKIHAIHVCADSFDIDDVQGTSYATPEILKRIVLMGDSRQRWPEAIPVAAPRLGWCEVLIGMTAPKGRIVQTPANGGMPVDHDDLVVR